MENFSLSCELQSFIRDQQKRISKASSVEDVQQFLDSLLNILIDGALPTLESSPSERNFLKAEFAQEHFVRCSDLIFHEPSVAFLPFLDDLHHRNLERFFMEGPSSESFLVLVSGLTQTSKPDSARVIVSLLEKFIESRKIVDVLVKSSLKDSQKVNNSCQLKLNQMISFLVSLPERVTNKLRLKSKSLFYPEAYFTELAQQMKESLEVIHSKLCSESNNINLSYLSNVIGRISMAGHGKTLVVSLLPHFENWLSISPLWLRICQKVLTGVQDHELEPVLENILKQANNPVIVSKLFGDCILSNSRFKYLMTTKFLLLRYYSDVKILRNIVGYFSETKHHDVLTEVLDNVLDSWGSKTSIQHTPYHQHVYISCCIVHITGYLGDEERAKHKNEILKKLLNGVQNHLDNPDHKIRRLGMIVAECLTYAVEPNAEKLCFEYDDDDESSLIKDLSKGPSSNKERNSSSNPKDNSNISDTQEKHREQNGNIGANDMEDDDDDDLQPYDIDEEEDFEAGKPFRHLRDCMEVLVESKDSDKFDLALKSLERVISSYPSDLNEVCCELMKILIHLHDQFSTDDFPTLRHKSMVAIATRCPIPVANYLTDEFYGANYSIIQRLDMLDVLVATAKVLSQPVELANEKATSKRFLASHKTESNIVDGIPEWQKVVQERIEKKTRRFAKGPTKEQPKPVANKFTSIAGYFFYPLMKNFDHKQNTLDLLGEDNYVLGRLIYTLGVIVHHATGAPGVHNMGVALIEFSWALRYHPEAIVRQMLVFALVMVFTSVPIVMLLSDSKETVFEIHNWLKDLMEKDDNIDVKQAAVQALMVLDDAFKKEMMQNMNI